MFKILKNKKGQGMVIQYAMTFFLVVAVITGMQLYFRRVIMARTADSLKYIAKEVSVSVNDVVGAQYEPYYVETAANRDATSDQVASQLADIPSSTGISHVEYNEQTTTHSVSAEAPPKDAQ